MTVTYTSEVATSTFGCFVKLLFRWRGSIYKLIWKDFLVYMILYYIVRVVYRYALTEAAQRRFESLAKYSDTYVGLIPLAFVLGFYVQQVVARWHLQFDTIPYPDTTAVLVTAYVKGLDERGRLIRRTMMRYLMLGYVMTMRSIAPAVKRRFPTMKHLTDAGLMSPQEEKILENINVTFNKYSIPFIWATSLVSLARKEGRIYDDYAVAVLNDSFNTVRQRLNRLFLFDWVGIPLVYTQVVTLSVYLYFVLTLFSQQFLIRKDGLANKDVDLIIPVAAILQFFFFMGWLKVAETLINPFGEDDDDFEVNAYIDRNMQLAYLAVDGIHDEHPPLVKDMYWGTQQFELPYTEATLDQRRKSIMKDASTEDGSAAGVSVPESKSAFVRAESSVQELIQKTGRKLSKAGLMKSESPHQIASTTPETTRRRSRGETIRSTTSDESESGHSLKRLERTEKQGKPEQREPEKLVGILKMPSPASNLDFGLGTPLRRSETAPHLDAAEKDPVRKSVTLGNEDTAPRNVSSLLSLQSDEDDDDEEKALKVIDLPLSPSAVKRQRQMSLFEHRDKVAQSRMIEAEELTSRSEDRPARREILRSLRGFLTGVDQEEHPEAAADPRPRSSDRRTSTDSYHNV